MPCKSCERRRAKIKQAVTDVVQVVSKAFIRKAQREQQQNDRLEQIRLNRSTGGSQKVDTYD